MLNLIVVLCFIGLVGIAKLLFECMILCQNLRKTNAKKKHDAKWEKIFADVYGD